MADKIQNTSNSVTRRFTKGLFRDIEDSLLTDGVWTHARNAINNSKTGDLGSLGNEPSNTLCASSPIPLVIIGVIHLDGTRWAIFSTNDTTSEIGLFDEGACTYVQVADDSIGGCLNFKKSNPIIGVSRENEDCTWQIYWDDGLNPSRTMNFDKPPFVETCVTVNNCITCTPNPPEVDCDKLRLARLTKTPCLRVEKGPAGGTLRNGSYYAVIAYTIKKIRVTDYSVPSNIQSLFDHDNVAGSLDIHIDDVDKENYDEFELVIVATVNQQTVAKRLGVYNVRQSVISLDQIKEDLPSIPIELIPLRTPLYDKSDAMFEVGEYLVRTGPATKLDFNYQPLANQIVTKWASVQYPSDYYAKGGSQTSYLRDEVYSFFIRWLYDTGDKSPSYHIPGRAPNAIDIQTVAGADALIEINEGITPFRWRVYNTATVTSLVSSTLPDGGVQVAEGLMGYWESTELYPDDKIQIWGNLCGQPIRHHRFPDNGLHPNTHHINPGATSIRVMGVKFENVQIPLDNLGNPILNIVGYEILRGSREGNKSVIAKGIINNMGQYAIEGGITPRQGYYPNYPYNDLRPDPFLSTTETQGGCNPGTENFTPQASFSRDRFTFHSPDTQFKNPFLSAKEIKVYGELNGVVQGQFTPPDKHPKHKLITNLAFLAAFIGGIGVAMLASNGRRTIRRSGPRPLNEGGSGAFAGPAGIGSWAAPGVPFTGISELGISGVAFNGAYHGVLGGLDAAWYKSGIGVLGAAAGTGPDLAYYTPLQAAGIPGSGIPGMLGYITDIDQQETGLTATPTILRVFNALPTFSYYLGEGTDSILRIIRNLVPYRQYALQYTSQCLYDSFQIPQANNQRRTINDAIYITPSIQDFGGSDRINNLYRSKSVALQTSITFADPLTQDITRQRVGDNPGGVTHVSPLLPFATISSCHYSALKQRIRNQYGQLDGIQQVPVSVCPTTVSPLISPVSATGVLFNGDTYVTRYTEKNSFFFFYDWLYDQPDGFEFSYQERKMLPFPRYWMDTTQFDFNDFTSAILSNLLTPANWDNSLPNNRFRLDRTGPCFAIRFSQKEAYMYLFSSGVRDFYVESEINTDLRDWGEDIEQRHYDPYRFTDTLALFNAKPATIKSGNYFKYDISLSVSRLFNNFISWANIQDRDYDPLVAQTCFSYYPDRVIYSLPQQTELRKDNWRMFLANNYKDFKSRVTAIKPINKSGALILFQNEAPVQFQGLDQLQTDLGTKLTIGDGGLFSQPLQNILNADRPYEYGSCQNRLSVINTPMGAFWMSQNQGKIFQIGQGIQEISAEGLKWWFAEYLPYKILESFPNFELKDNTIIGVGCQAIYDNEDGIVYFTKRDFKLIPNLPVVVTYVSKDDFLVNGSLPIKLGDPLYFEDASWTVSYDPKMKIWLSYHDWHPNLLMPSKTHFLSVLSSGIWRHNNVCNSYCNFYGIDYPFEVEFYAPTEPTVFTTRSIEYVLECYRYSQNCFDGFHVLDFNFDEAIVFNTEQVSGILRLNLSPKNNPAQTVTFPNIQAGFINILYSKEENKYRFNQFWDITDDRGEFNLAAQRAIWNTSSNGYVKTLNPNNLNYNKPLLQRKKFRHYLVAFFLRRRVSGSTKMLFKVSTVKQLLSPR